jgi:Domain of unknown function (DUF4397)
MRKNWIALFLATAALLAACGGGTDRTKAQVRLVNASGGYSTLDLRVDDQLRQGGVGEGGTAGYIEVDPDKAGMQITQAGSPTPLLSFTPGLSERRYYTVLAYGEAGTLRQHVLDDNSGEPADNRALLRVVNAASNAGALDIYLTASGDDIGSAVAVQAGAAYGNVGGWITVNSGTWRLRVTAAGDKDDVRLDVPAVSLPSKHITTLVITPSAGGVLVNGLLLAQRSAITRADATQARVRLAAGVTGSPAVSATVAGVTLGPGVAPLISNYSVVPAGAASVVATVAGVAQPAVDVTLEPGRDYTLLVQGTPAAVRVGRLADDNKLPTDNTKAKLRLVNGMAESTAVLSLSVDLLQVGSPASSGAASGYAAVRPTSGNGDGELLVLEGGTQVFRAADQQLAAGNVYTVFVLGSQSAATGRLRRDR